MMCGNNHWIITPNLARSIQIDLWPGGPKSYLWQPVIASPVIQQTNYPVIIPTHHYILTLPMQSCSTLYVYCTYVGICACDNGYRKTPLLCINAIHANCRPHDELLCGNPMCPIRCFCIAAVLIYRLIYRLQL